MKRQLLAFKKYFVLQILAGFSFLYLCFRAGRAVAHQSSVQVEPNGIEHLDILRTSPRKSNPSHLSKNDNAEARSPVPKVSDLFKHDNWRDTKEELCRQRPPTLVALVTSAPGNFKARDAIRRSWGQHVNEGHGVFVLAFVVGATPHDLTLQVEPTF